MRVRRHQQRTGNVLAMTVVLLVAMFALLAFAVDFGYLFLVRSQLQATADATALAAAWDLIDEDALTGSSYPWLAAERARATAAEYAAYNPVAGQPPLLAFQDVEIGYLDPFSPDGEMSFNDPGRYNTVRVLVRRTADQNGEVPLFFARVLGTDSAPRSAQATAAFVGNINGFQTPSSGENLDLLPFALDIETWNAMLEGTGTDDWAWDAEFGQVESRSDGILEINLFPQGTGSPGNRGTVDIGSENNSTSDIARQILHGISPADLAYHGGKLELDENGEMFLNGDTGISAGVKDELATVKGKARMIGLFNNVIGPGNNAVYTIVHFVGIRIMDVKLTGSMSSKRVIIQPAIVSTAGAIPATSEEQRSRFIYTPVRLIR